MLVGVGVSVAAVVGISLGTSVASGATVALVMLGVVKTDMVASPISFVDVLLVPQPPKENKIPTRKTTASTLGVLLFLNTIFTASISQKLIGIITIQPSPA